MCKKRSIHEAVLSKMSLQVILPLKTNHRSACLGLMQEINSLIIIIERNQGCCTHVYVVKVNETTGEICYETLIGFFLDYSFAYYGFFLLEKSLV